MRMRRASLLARDATRIFRAAGDIARNYAAVVSVKSQARMPIFDLASNLASKANPPFRVIVALHRRVLNGPKRNVDGERREREGKSVGKCRVIGPKSGWLIVLGIRGPSKRFRHLDLILFSFYLLGIEVLGKNFRFVIFGDNCCCCVLIHR